MTPYQQYSVAPYSGAPISAQSALLGGQPLVDQQTSNVAQPTATTSASPLLGAASSYQYPLTSSLLSSISQPGAVSNIAQNMGNTSPTTPQAATTNPSPTMLPQDANTPAPYTGPDYSAIALQMAGNPHAGAYAPAAVPSGSFITNPATSSSSSSGTSALGETAAGLLAAMGIVNASPALTSSLASLLGISNQLPLLSTSGAAISGSAADTGNLGSAPITSDLTADPGAPGSGLDLGTGSIDLSGADGGTDDTGDLTSLLDSLGFSGAGGQAAVAGSAADTGSLGSNPISSPDVAGDVGAPGTGIDLSTNDSGLSGSASSGLLGSLGLGAGAVGGLLSGTPTGDAQAGIDATKLAAQSGLLGSSGSAVNAGATDAGSALGLYSGLQAGGVTGDAQAAVSAAQLANQGAQATGLLSSGAGATASSLLGDVAAPLALYNFANNWESGATGSDAINGAGAGAAVGTAITPGIGTAIGALGGAAVGALSSIAGGGKVDPETASDESLDTATAAQQQAVLSNPTDAQTYLTGIFDAKNDTAGHSTPLEQVFGRMGEGNFTSALNDTLSSAANSGAINASTPPSQIYSQVVAPWLASKGATIDPNGLDANGNPMGQNMIAAVTTLIGNYQAHGFSLGATASASSLQAAQNAQQNPGASLLASMMGQPGQQNV